MTREPKGEFWGMIVFAVFVSVIVIIALIRLRLPSQHSSQEKIREPVVSGVEPFRGDNKAATTIVEFGDFGCPACKAEAPRVRQAIEARPEELKVIWKDLPNEKLHPGIRLTHHAARCAYQQRRFWEYHDLIFAQSETPTQKEPLLALAQALSLDLPRFSRCLNDQNISAQIDKDIAEAESLGVRATPTFFIGSRQFKTFPSL